MKLKNDLLLRCAQGESVERPPVWLMRQAGRILPQYRAIRERLSGFKELVSTPALAAEVTIQPVDELDVDAAIIFSDILVIPEALGLDYEMEEKRGPHFPKVIGSEADIRALREADDAAERLRYVYEALSLTKTALKDRVPLIGFCGAPWTILAYMVEGGGSKTFSHSKRLLYTRPDLAHLLLEKITAASIAYLKQQLQHGANLVQVFDSWAGMLSPEQYRSFALPYIARICDELSPLAPVTVFAKGAWFALPEMAHLNCHVIGIDWNTSPQQARAWVGTEKILQGNLDPCALYAEPEHAAQSAQDLMQAFGRKHIVNLGHGLYPDTPLESVRAFVQAAKAYRYDDAPQGR